MRRIAISVSALLTLAIPAFPQAHGPLPPLTAHVEVKVINVDVVATDPAGRPVTDLTKDDFEVFEDDQPQKITNFYVIEKAAVHSEKRDENPGGTPVTEQFRRKIVLLVDNNYIDKPVRDAALDKIEKFIDDNFSGDHEWAVAAIGLRLEVMQPFTSNRAEIHAAISKVRHTPAFSDLRQMDRSLLSDRTRRADLPPEHDYGETVRFQAREQSYRNFRAVTHTAKAVADMTRACSGTEGKKVIILVTGGMEMHTTFAAYESTSDRELEQIKLDTWQTIDDMVREANVANFTIHVLNAKTRGMAAPQHEPQNKSSGIDLRAPLGILGSDPIDTSDVDSSPLTLALGTGGSYLTSRVEQSLERIDVLTSNYYSLGYSPPHEDDRKYHSIKVRVKRSGVRIAHRQGYIDLSPEDRLEQSLRASLSFMRPPGTLPVSVRLEPSSPKGERVLLPIVTILPMERVTMIPIDGQYVGRVHVYVSVFDADGNNIGFHHQLQEVTLSPAEFEHVSDGVFRYKMNVNLDRGRFRVVITLRDELSNEIGSASETVEI